MRVALLVLAILGACDTPDLKIVYRVADGTDGYTCGTSECADVPMTCQAVLHVRVLRPSDPIRPFISVCEEVTRDTNKDLCAIAAIDLPVTELPRETLEVQVTVWPRELVLDDKGNLDCGRVPVTFDATMGFPVSSGSTTAMPAFGGRAFYHPGDAETDVTLGCTDVPSINQASCTGGLIDITATVGDFENLPFTVSPTVGDRLAVRIGEPKPFDDGVRVGHSFLTSDTSELTRTIEGPTPTWGGGADLAFQSTACLQVEENVAQSTAALRCRFASPADLTDKRLDIQGIRLPKATLDQILTALQLPRFPDEGLTIGIVLDHVGNPVEGAVVNSTNGTIEYINAVRTGTTNTGTTSLSGIFVSRDAAYGTIFSTAQVNQTITAVGGRVDGNVTVVMLQFDMPPIGG